MTADGRPLDILFIRFGLLIFGMFVCDIPFAFLSRIMDLNFQPAARLEVAHVSKVKDVGFMLGAVLS